MWYESLFLIHLFFNNDYNNECCVIYSNILCIVLGIQSLLMEWKWKCYNVFLNFCLSSLNLWGFGFSIPTASCKNKYFNWSNSNKTFLPFMPFSFVIVQEDEGMFTLRKCLTNTLFGIIFTPSTTLFLVNSVSMCFQCLSTNLSVFISISRRVT